VLGKLCLSELNFMQSQVSIQPAVAVYFLATGKPSLFQYVAKSVKCELLFDANVYSSLSICFLYSTLQLRVQPLSLCRTGQQQ